jgi:hypothetical protein
MIVRKLGPNHPENNDFLQQEQRKVDQWNAYANQWNDINRRMGGTKPILKPKRNPYLT